MAAAATTFSRSLSLSHPSLNKKTKKILHKFSNPPPFSLSFGRNRSLKKPTMGKKVCLNSQVNALCLKIVQRL